MGSDHSTRGLTLLESGERELHAKLVSCWMISESILDGNNLTGVSQATSPQRAGAFALEVRMGAARATVRRAEMVKRE